PSWLAAGFTEAGAETVGVGAGLGAGLGVKLSTLGGIGAAFAGGVDTTPGVAAATGGLGAPGAADDLICWRLANQSSKNDEPALPGFAAPPGGEKPPPACDLSKSAFFLAS